MFVVPLCGDAGVTTTMCCTHVASYPRKPVGSGTQSHKNTQEHIHTLEMFYVLFICDKFGGTHMHAQLKQFLPKPFIPYMHESIWRIEMEGRRGSCMWGL